MQLESGEMAGVLWKDEAEIDVQAYGIAIDPGQFIICWTCHFSATDASILREHLFALWHKHYFPMNHKRYLLVER